MGQQTMAEQVGTALKRLILVVAVAAVMVVALAASAATAFAEPNPDSAAGQCTPNVGADTKFAAKQSGSTKDFIGRAPGQGVREACAPGQ